MFSLADKVAIVTGAAAGIGKAVLRRFWEAGASVVALDRDEKAVLSVSKELEGEGASILPIVADVADEEAVKKMAGSTLERFGRIDILVNNAGIAGSAKPILETSVGEWKRVFEVNLDSLFYCCRAVLPSMMENRRGRIINVSSIAGKEGNPNMIPYSTSKAGVIGFTKALAKEMTDFNILVNAVTPAVIRTPILEQLTQTQVDYMLRRIPLARIGEPEEVAAVIHFLASDDASFVTGQVYDVSGGRATY